MTVSYPQAYLSIGGAMIPCETATVTRHARREPDTFSATFAADVAAAQGLDLNFWADYQPQDAQILMGTQPGGGDLRSMVTGTIDVPEISWFDMKISVKSRDKSAKLGEKKLSKTYKNQKSSEIAQDIGQQAGLDTSGVQDSGDYSGQKYDQDTVHLALNRSLYEIMNDLADREGFRWYVDGTTLYFEPDGQSSGTFSVYYSPPTPGQVAEGNCIKLVTARNMTAAQQHRMTVKSFHHHDKKLYSATEQAGGAGSDTIEHEHHHNGRNQDQVEKLAKSRLKNAIRHDLNVSIEMPGDLSVDVRQTLSLSGTGTIYDQSLDIDTVSWHVSWGEGFTMDLEAKSAKAGRQQ